MSVHLYVDKIFVNEFFFRGIEFGNLTAYRDKYSFKKPIDIKRFN